MIHNPYVGMTVKIIEKPGGVNKGKELVGRLGRVTQIDGKYIQVQPDGDSGHRNTWWYDRDQLGPVQKKETFNLLDEGI